MKLLTHNMLSSNIKGAANGFPLRVEEEKVKEKTVEINTDLLRKMFKKIDWKALYGISRAMGYAESPKRSTCPCWNRTIFCAGSTMPFWNSTLKKVRLFAQTLDDNFPSIKRFLICFFMRTRCEY